jgi:hypothetical protein
VPDVPAHTGRLILYPAEMLLKTYDGGDFVTGDTVEVTHGNRRDEGARVGVAMVIGFDQDDGAPILDVRLESEPAGLLGEMLGYCRDQLGWRIRPVPHEQT